MVHLYRDTGIVLRTHKLGEADRIVVLMTAGRGKVRAVAKGVRKTKSRFGGRLEPPTHLALQCYEGRELHTVTQVESIDHFRRIHDDLDGLSDALALVEAVDQIAREEHADRALYLMLLRALRTLDAAPSPLLVAAFYLKLLGHDGAGPILDGCAHCGSQGVELVAFDLVEGGALCRSCRRGPALSPGALELMRRILGGDLGGALAQPAGPLTGEVGELATRALEVHLERRLRVVRLLERS
jgi:DNA repair protein RecO (recombination protein O)